MKELLNGRVVLSLEMSAHLCDRARGAQESKETAVAAVLVTPDLGESSSKAAHQDKPDASKDGGNQRKSHAHGSEILSFLREWNDFNLISRLGCHFLQLEELGAVNH